MGKLIYAVDRRRGGVLASGRLGPLEFRRRDCVLKGRRADRILLFHHDPNHDDVWLDESEQRAQLLASSYGIVPTLAREGMVLALS